MGKLATNIKNIKKPELHIEIQTDKGDKGCRKSYIINKNRNNRRHPNNNKDSNNRRDAKNFRNTSRSRDLNNCREDSNSRESSCIRDFSEKTTEV